VPPKSKRRRLLAGGVGVWLAGLAASIGLALAEPAVSKEAADAAGVMITGAVMGTSGMMIKKGLETNDERKPA
jgi:hypothetical protein